jgi:hypothetical protein
VPSGSNHNVSLETIEVPSSLPLASREEDDIESMCSSEDMFASDSEHVSDTERELMEESIKEDVDIEAEERIAAQLLFNETEIEEGSDSWWCEKCQMENTQEDCDGCLRSKPLPESENFEHWPRR